MIIDTLANAHRYYMLHAGIKEAFHYLQDTDLQAIAPGRYAIDGDSLYAIVQEYETLDAAGEQMEAHRKYIDVQYMISGEERVGHALWHEQSISKVYSEEEDYMLYGDKPDFFSRLAEGTFMVFFPTDLHMPCIRTDAPGSVKKIVVKVAVG